MTDMEKKRGRKPNVERLGRERSASHGGTVGVEECWKRLKDSEVAEEGVFQKSGKTARSPGRRETEKSEEKGVDTGCLEEWKMALREEWKKELEGLLRREAALKEEVVGLRREMVDREERWRKEKEEMVKRLGEVERRLGEVEGRGRWKREERVKEAEVADGARQVLEERREGEEEVVIGRRVKEMVEKMERREREERRKNVIMKKVKMGKSARETAEIVLGKIGAGVKVVEVREIGRRRKQGEETMLEVKLESVEGKREVMRKKGMLQGGREFIGDDWTWRERKMQWRLREIGSEEARRGKRVRVGYGKVFINGVVWFWDEEGVKLRDGGGRVWANGKEQGDGGKN
ncbi:hypothetical protein M0802_014123 [Mischocyttarus mexicanus]|nr:hypothetical protein M0802_014123 [Mischocyttarus mexicanus]